MEEKNSNDKIINISQKIEEKNKEKLKEYFKYIEEKILEISEKTPKEVGIIILIKDDSDNSIHLRVINKSSCKDINTFDNFLRQFLQSDLVMKLCNSIWRIDDEH